MTNPAHESDVRLADPSNGGESAGSKPRGSSSDAVAIRPMTPVPLAWRSWPVLDSPGEFVVLTVAVIGLIGAAYFFSGPLSAITASVVLSIVAWRRYVPTLFELSALGVSENCIGLRRRIPWISVDRFVLGRKGAYLSSFGAPLEMMRGLYLPWNGNREQIVATLRYYLPRAEDAADA